MSQNSAKMPNLSIFFTNFAFQVPVGDRAGSTPVIRTREKERLHAVPILIFLNLKVLSAMRGGENCFRRRI